MTEQGVVIKCKGNFAKVRIGRNSACAACGKCGMTEKQRHVDFYADNSVGASEGANVTLEIPENNSAKLAFVAYILPLVPALTLLFVALALKWNEWWAVGLFFGGLLLGFAVIAVIDKVRKHKWMETPVITAIIATNAPEASQADASENEFIKKENNNE